MSAIAIHNVSKRFGEHQAVNGVSLTVPEGSIYGFIGPNGSGKPMAEVDVAIKDGLGRLQPGDWADKKVETLSKGLAQKVQFIAAVVSSPKRCLSC